MITGDIQKNLFTQIKNSLPDHLNLVDQLSDLLKVSTDSIYRRVRGEKQLTLQEAQIICEHYNLSLDSFLQVQDNTVLFKASDLNKKEFSFMEILLNMQMQLGYMNSFQEKKMWYLCKDMPFWQFYLYDDLAAFKSFFWARTIHNEAKYSNKKFSLKNKDFIEHIKIGKSCVDLYNNIPSIELWNLESINSTLSQIRFYIYSAVFAEKSDVIAVIDSFDATIDHLWIQAEKGYKFNPASPQTGKTSSLQFYVNEVVIGSNTILADLDKRKIAFIPYNVFSFLHTTNEAFTDTVFKGIENLRTKSTLVSTTGEKERNRFFEQLKTEIAALKDLV